MRLKKPAKPAFLVNAFEHFLANYNLLCLYLVTIDEA